MFDVLKDVGLAVVVLAASLILCVLVPFYVARVVGWLLGAG